MAIHPVMQSLISEGLNLVYFVHASDTTGGRNAGYTVFVHRTDTVFYPCTAYGSIGTSYRRNQLGAFANQDDAINAARDALKKKTNKNYVVDSSSTEPNAFPKRRASVVPKLVTYSMDMANMETTPLKAEYVTNDNYHMELLPAYAVMNYFVFKNQGTHIEIGVYFMSGNCSEFIQVTPPNLNLQVIYKDDMVFQGYVNDGNVILTRYLRMLGKQQDHKMNYITQRNIMEAFVDDFYANPAYNIFDKSLKVSVNPSFVDRNIKDDIINGGKLWTRYAKRIAIFEESDLFTEIKIL